MNAHRWLRTIKNCFSQKNRSPRRSGFSLIQVIVAIVILTTSLSATVVLVGSVIRQVSINKNRITAIYLAQECLELVRNVRDSAWRQNFPWDCAFGDNYQRGDQFTITPNKITTPFPPVPNCQKNFGAEIQKISDSLKGNLFLSSFGFSHQSSNEQTPFQRILTLSDIREDQLTITCQVTWDDEKISFSEILTDWHKK